MNLRTKKRRVLSHFQNLNDPVKEYTGGEIKIQELQSMRKPDPTQVPPNIDYQDYFKPMKTSWGPMMSHKRA